MNHFDTIAAIASGLTASGIGIIRISGPEAFALLGRIFRPKRPGDPLSYRSHTVHYGWIMDPGGAETGGSDMGGAETGGAAQVVDECLVTVMRAPRTYTTEDTVEINCHGGPYVMRRILRLVLENGARAAEPGEFTKRAFLGGRLDLSEAEAVMDVIGSRSADALSVSVMQLQGSVRREVSALREGLLGELARIEAALDDPEHLSLDGYTETLASRIEDTAGRIRRLADTFAEGSLIREGILTVILGKPNAGKSSLLNAITGGDRAIVTDIEGTTRDVIEETASIGGISLRLIDTAGIRSARDEIEKIGIERASMYAERADLILAVFDPSRALDENDRRILALLKGKKAIVLLNKSDLPPLWSEKELQELAGTEEKAEAGTFGSEAADEIEAGPSGSKAVPGATVPVLSVSAKDRSGFPELEQAVRSLFFARGAGWNEETVITRERHASLLREAGKSLDLVLGSIRAGMPEDFYSIDLMDACRRLGEITGEDTAEDLVNTIFSKFCMGK